MNQKVNFAPKFFLRSIIFLITLLFLFSSSFALQIGTSQTGNCGTVFCNLTDDIVYWANMVGIPSNLAYNTLDNIFTVTQTILGNLNVIGINATGDVNTSGALRSTSNQLCNGSVCYSINDLNITSSSNSITDTNCALYGACPLVAYVSDVNSWFVLNTNYNSLGDSRWIKLTDFNTLGDTRYSLLGHDHSALYYTKSEIDTNFALYLLKTDYADTNWQTSWITLDANLKATYPLKSDVNSWGDLRYAPIGSSGSVDTNWQTSWTTFDSNMKATYQLKGNYVLEVDGNAWYVKQVDLNTLIDSGTILRNGMNVSLLTNDSNFQTYSNVLALLGTNTSNPDYVKVGDSNLTNYYTKLDSNTLFAFRTDINAWGDLRYAPLGSTGGTDTNTETKGWTNGGGVWQIDLNSTQNLKASGNNLCDSTTCYKISDLNITGGGGPGGWVGLATSDLNMANKNITDVNKIYANVIWADANHNYGTMYCTDGNIVMGYLAGYTC
ncbi:MAG: hypothetical protein WCW13_02570 [archaeon]|jgi:hypothetical protein